MRGSRRRLRKLREGCAVLDLAVPVGTGDLVEDLPQLLAGAPEQATLVVMYSSTPAYVDAAKRAAFLDPSVRPAHTGSARKDHASCYAWPTKIPSDVGGRS